MLTANSDIQGSGRTARADAIRTRHDRRAQRQSGAQTGAV